ncbi:MAG: transketolase C-terminal domain-containing protein [Candidatus Choladocola sp.]|nr:transketolase C-terminal domain-containing protein [Candidatus Choladocola sp.]
MNHVDISNIKDFKIKFRPMFGKVIKELAEKNSDIFLVLADSGRACRVDGFEKCPDQFIDCGIAEQDMIGVAAGLAHCGKKPVAFAFAPFASERCFEQVRLDVAYAQTNVVIVGSEGGVSMGTQGVTHFGFDDIGAISSLPGMTVICPADHISMIKCLEMAIEYDKPVYLRLNGGIPETIYGEKDDFCIGGSVIHGIGSDANILAAGPIVNTACKVADSLKREGYSIGVVDMYSLKPIDVKAVEEVCKAAHLVVSLEEHNITNGLGSMIASEIACQGLGNRLLKLGLPDEYPHTVSPYQIMMEDYGLTESGIAETLRRELRQEVRKVFTA